MYAQETTGITPGYNVKSTLGYAGDRPSSVVNATMEVTGATQQAMEILKQAQSIADDYFGPAQPQGESNKPPTPPVSGDSLSRELNALRSVLAALSAQIDRLTCI